MSTLKYACERQEISSILSKCAIPNISNRREIVLFVYRYGFTIEKIPPDCFRASEATMRNLFRLFASLWNGAVHTVLRLAEGRDWNLLFKVTISSIFWQSVFLSFLKLGPSFAMFLDSILVFATA